MYQFPKTCHKHNLPLVLFCDKKHKTMDLEQYQNLDSWQYFDLHQRYGDDFGQLNWDEGMVCERGCKYTNSVILKGGE